MARKKQEKPNQIKAQSNLSLQYEGDVTISILRKGKVLKKIKNHNEGTNYLFRFILDCLAGNYYENNRPFWITPFYRDTGGRDKYSLPVFIPINEAEVFETSDSCVLSYRCLIPSAFLSNISTQMDGLLFYSNANKGVAVAGETIDNNYSMKMSFGEIDNNIFFGKDVLIDWQIRIVSARQQEENSGGN